MTTDDYFQNAKRWKPEMLALRELILQTNLQEELKWYQPCYTFNGKNVAIISSFKDYCIIGFFKGSLIHDPNEVLISPGKNTQSGRQMRFSSLDEIKKHNRLIHDLIRQAIVLEKSGKQVVYKKTDAYPIPDELKAVFKTNKEYKTAFQQLTPGRQRGYLLYFSGAKQSSTRSARIEKVRSSIMNGRGLHDR
ncbi:MAG: YdeI/OmpD-associated family protein [Bacteroidota bacterium]